MKIRKALVAAALTLTPVAAGSAQTQMWARQIGTESSDSAYAVAPDGAGGAFVGGYTSGQLSRPWYRGTDGWLARYDADGSQLWILQFGTDSADSLRALSPDGAGGVYAGGWTSGDLGGEAAGGTDAWIARYSGNGDLLWVRQIGSASTDYLHDLAGDETGVFCTGMTRGSLGGPAGEEADAWLARFDGDGNEQWIRQWGGSDVEIAHGVDLDGAGGAMVVGGRVEVAVSWYADAWLARYDAEGERSWFVQFGTPGYEVATAVASDGAGGAFVAGQTEGSYGAPLEGEQDVWIARVDASGEQWVRQIGSVADEEVTGLATDGAGGVFATGWTEGELSSPAIFPADAWLALYSADGTLGWVHQFGTSEGDTAYGVASDSASGAFVAGTTTGALGGASAGGLDVWIARYTDSCYADCDGSGSLDFFDFLCFQNLFAAGDPEADCDGSGELDLFDFLCFQNAFAAGCS